MLPPVRHGPVDRGLVEWHALEGVHVESGLGPAEDQVAVGPQHPPHPLEDLSPGLRLEVDEDVAQEQHVHGRQRRERGREVELPGVDQPAQRLVDLPFGAGAGEVPDELGRGQAAVDLELAVARGPGPSDHLL